MVDENHKNKSRCWKKKIMLDGWDV